MRTFSRLISPFGVFLAFSLFMADPQSAQAQAEGSLSGVVVPDLPPEVSPGDEVSFTPPAGSEGGTWMLCGEVAAPEEDPEQQAEPEMPRPAATQLGLKPDPALAPLSEEQALGLALAAAMQEEPAWAACLSGRPGRPGANDHPPAAGDPLPDVDVALEKRPTGSYQLRIVVAELPQEQASKAVTPADKHKGSEKITLPSDQAAADLRNLAGTSAGIRYFAVDLQEGSGGKEPEHPFKSYFESRSNTARYAEMKPEMKDAAGYSIPLQDNSGGTAAGNVLIASVDGLFDEGEIPPVVVAMAAKAKKGYVVGKGGDARSVAFAPVQCQSPPPAGPREATQARHGVQKSAIRNVKSLVVKIPQDYKPGQPFPVSFKDPSGRTVLNVDNVETVHVVPPRPRPADPRPSLDAAPEYSIAGRTVCACGYFPDSRSRGGLLFDERAVQPISASSQMAILPLPATVPPGRHRISGSPAAGFSEKAVYTNVVQVNGKLDANKLRSGQATQMELTIVGTDKPLPLKIVNKTPQVISIGGQVEQTLTTSGGTPNRLVQTVNSLGPGNFGIDFSLAADRCPCQSHTYYGTLSRPKDGTIFAAETPLGHSSAPRPY